MAKIIYMKGIKFIYIYFDFKAVVVVSKPNLIQNYPVSLANS